MGAGADRPRRHLAPAAAEGSGAAPAAGELALRLRQQEILAEFGVLALRGQPLEELIARAAELAAEGLQAELSKVMRYQPDGDRLLVEAGVGWRPGVVGEASIGADDGSPAGYALKTGRPVVTNDLARETRFRTPQLLAEHGVRRAVNVILQGEGAPYGVMEVDSRQPGEFSERDIVFLQGAANLLGMAIERRRVERDLKAALDRQGLLLKEVNHRVSNSLQLVQALLQVQSGMAGDPALKPQLSQAASRVAAIGRVHRRLYRDGQLLQVDLADYLGDVCADLGESLRPCTIETALEPGLVTDTDRAISVALLLTELLTNAAKYAYPGAAGSIRVELRRNGERARLAVRDHGVGLPAGFTMAGGSSLGMRLIDGLARQLQGEMAFHAGEPGVEARLQFPPRRG